MQRDLVLVGLVALLSLALMAPARADFPDVDKLPSRPGLPDPLVMMDGTRVKTADDWAKKRRPELKALFQHYMYGQMPAAPKKVTAKVLHEDKKAFGGKATLKELELTVGPAEAPKLHLLLVVPNARKGPAPVFVGLNFSGNHSLVDDAKVRLPTAWMRPARAGAPGVKDNKATEAGRGKQKDVWALEQSIDRGYAVATMYYGEIDPDRAEPRGGLRPYLDKKGAKPTPHDTATIAAWAWGIHRAVDYLVTDKELDPKKICVVGHSRLGKTALLAAAFDERIALAVPSQAGCGGTAPSRSKNPKAESVKRINTSFPHWFCGAFKDFNDKPDRLPFDQHCLAALVAPRPVLFSNAEEDTWANPAGQFEVLQAADPVYRLLKAGGLEAKKMPPLGELSAGTLGYYIRPGKHSMTKGDWKVYLDFADAHLGKPAGRVGAAAKKRLLLVGQGPDGHKATTHEYMAGLKVLAKCLEEVPGLEVTTTRADGPWKDGPELLERADGVVLFLAEGAAWAARDPKRAQALERMLKRGGGLTVLHWAMGTKDAEPIKGFLELAGGCHGGPDRKYKELKAETDATVAAPKHPAMTGVKDFRVKDEFYYQLKFVKSGKEVVPLLRAKIEGKDEAVAWAWERPAGGRSFGFSGLHFHVNWGKEEYRRLVAQGVLWTMGLPVPKEGLKVKVGEEVLKLK